MWRQSVSLDFSEHIIGNALIEPDAVWSPDRNSGMNQDHDFRAAEQVLMNHRACRTFRSSFSYLSESCATSGKSSIRIAGTRSKFARSCKQVQL